MITYYGTSEKDTPVSILDLMREIGIKFGEANSILHYRKNNVGGEAFYSGTEISVGITSCSYELNRFLDAINWAKRLWNKCENRETEWELLSDGQKNILVSAIVNVMGIDLKTPIDMLICWTDCTKCNETTIALDVAKEYNNLTSHPIAIINLQKENHRTMMKNALRTGLSPEDTITNIINLTNRQLPLCDPV